MPVMNVPKFERFFRIAAGLDVDKNDVKRYNDFIDQKVYDLVIMAEASAKANSRDIIEPWDLPITKGLQESAHEFRDIDEEIELKPILEQLTIRPPLDLSLSEETRDRLPAIVGGLSLALARSFKLVDPDLKNPQTEDWERAFRLFRLLL